MAKLKKRPYNVKLDVELLDALRAIKERDGISESEQIRRGIRLWLGSRTSLADVKPPASGKE
jgi:Arc/MetJ-type ribon-helix-helix transcriptional regulator